MNFSENLKTVIHGLKLTCEAKLDIVSFPESFLTGYFRDEKEARVNCFAVDSPEMNKVLEETAHFKILFMVGFNELRDGKLYNTVVVIENGIILGSYSKAFPIFDYFTPGRVFTVFEKNGLRFGVIICADGEYIEPARILALKGARVIFAPYYNCVTDPVGHYQRVRNDQVARAIENRVYFVCGNNVIPKKDEMLCYGYGDSRILDPNGETVASAGLYDEYLKVYNLDLSRKYIYEKDRWFESSLKSATALFDILKNTIENNKRY